jgi:predicted methyltransferase
MAISKKKGSQHYPKKVSQTKVKKVANVLEKQMLVDLEKRISLNVGQFLVLTEEGDPTQIALAHQKAKSEFIKFAPEMSRLAQHIGGDIQSVVAEFLDSIDVVLHSLEFLDEDKISRCFYTTQRLEIELKF